MAEVKPMMIRVEALKVHSTEGKEYQIGDTYDVPESAVDNLATLGMAVRVDRAAHARKAAAPKKASAKRAVVGRVRKAGKHKS